MLADVTLDMGGYPLPLWPLLQGLTGMSSLTEFEDIWKSTTLLTVGLDLATGSLKEKEAE